MDAAKNVSYFRVDLGNGNQRRNPRLIEFVSAHSAPVTYLKSASYLLHESSHSWEDPRVVLLRGMGIVRMFHI